MTLNCSLNMIHTNIALKTDPFDLINILISYNSFCFVTTTNIPSYCFDVVLLLHRILVLTVCRQRNKCLLDISWLKLRTQWENLIWGIKPLILKSISCNSRNWALGLKISVILHKSFDLCCYLLHFNLYKLNWLFLKNICIFLKTFLWLNLYLGIPSAVVVVHTCINYLIRKANLPRYTV